jgi:hypothetical protein
MPRFKDIYINQTGISVGTIKIDSLGPCLVFLLDFELNGLSMAYLQHYSFLELDESGTDPPEVLEQFISIICENLLHHLGPGIIRPGSSDIDKLHVVKLIVVGGDVEEAKLIKTAFTLLDSSKSNVTLELNDSDESYLHQQLINRTIIFESVTKNWSSSDDKDDEDG